MAKDERLRAYFTRQRVNPYDGQSTPKPKQRLDGNVASHMRVVAAPLGAQRQQIASLLTMLSRGR